jgi:hypothetical protein
MIAVGRFDPATDPKLAELIEAARPHDGHRWTHQRRAATLELVEYVSSFAIAASLLGRTCTGLRRAILADPAFHAAYRQVQSKMVDARGLVPAAPAIAVQIEAGATNGETARTVRLSAFKPTEPARRRVIELLSQSGSIRHVARQLKVRLATLFEARDADSAFAAAWAAAQRRFAEAALGELARHALGDGDERPTDLKLGLALVDRIAAATGGSAGRPGPAEPPEPTPAEIDHARDELTRVFDYLTAKFGDQPEEQAAAADAVLLAEGH